MRAWSSLISKVLGNAAPFVHGHRLSAMEAAVGALLAGNRLSVTGLGRNVVGSSERHGVKRMDRLIGNRCIGAELGSFYRICANTLVGAKTRPIILVDWSELTPNGKVHLLRAAVSVGTRSLPIYDEVHPQHLATTRAAHTKFLQNLKALIPADCKPIVVTDAGFRGPWFAAVRAQGWDFIGRVRHLTMVRRCDDSRWALCKSLHKRATVTPRDLGAYEVARNSPTKCRLVLVKNKPKGRVHRTRFGKRARWTNSRKAAKSAREPWLLATSLPGNKAKRVVKGYASRMRIEESFRDTKDPRNGWGLRHSQSRSCARFGVLVAVDTVALMIAWLIGLLGERVSQQTAYQVSSTKKRRVLSVGYLGRRMFQRAPPTLPKRPYQWASKALSGQVLTWT